MVLVENYSMSDRSAEKSVHCRLVLRSICVWGGQLCAVCSAAAAQEQMRTDAGFNVARALTLRNCCCILQ